MLLEVLRGKSKSGVLDTNGRLLGKRFGVNMALDCLETPKGIWGQIRGPETKSIPNSLLDGLYPQFKAGPWQSFSFSHPEFSVPLANAKL